MAVGYGAVAALAQVGALPRGYTYYTCQPRGCVAPPGHPASLSLDEHILIKLLTDFFNTYVFGPDRYQLASATAAIARQRGAEEHRERIVAARFALADIEARQKRLLKILEENDDDQGRLYRQAKERQAELDVEHALKMAELDDLERTMPAREADAVWLLGLLPETKIDLADLPAHQLRPLLDAFAIQLHYDVGKSGIRVEATISAEPCPMSRDHLGLTETTSGFVRSSCPNRPRSRRSGPGWVDSYESKLTSRSPNGPGAMVADAQNDQLGVRYWRARLIMAKQWNSRGT